MKLLTKQIVSLFAKTGDQCQDADPIIVAKFFMPDGGWTWYASEYDPQEEIFFGYVIGHFPEWGTFALSDLEKVRGALRLPVERDLHFEPKRFSEINIM